MSRVKVKDEVRKKVTRIEVVEGADYKTKCDCCGKLFEPTDLKFKGELMITFDESRRGLGGNFDTWDVCSFTCAQKLLDGGWFDTPQAKGFRYHGRKLGIFHAECKWSPIIEYSPKMK